MMAVATNSDSAEARLTRLGMWLALGATCAVGDFLFAPILTSMMSGGRPPAWAAAAALSVVGCTLAQGNALAAWLVWSSESFPRRLVRHWTMAGLLYLSWYPGLAIAEQSQEFWHISVVVALLVPAVSLGAQLPHWIVRHFCGWRLVRDQAGVATQRDAPLTIRDLIWATLVVAVTVSILRWLPPVIPKINGPWLFIAAAMTIAAVISTIGTLPAGPLLMRMRPFRRGLFWGGIYTAALVAIVWIVVLIQWWYAPSGLGPFQGYVGLSSLMLSYGATLMVVAGCARVDGYRLVTRRDAVNQPGFKAAGVTVRKMDSKSMAAD